MERSELRAASVPLRLGFLQAIGALAYFTGIPSFNLDLGTAVVLVLLVFMLPLVHLFMATTKMQRALQAA